MHIFQIYVFYSWLVFALLAINKQIRLSPLKRADGDVWIYVGLAIIALLMIVLDKIKKHERNKLMVSEGYVTVRPNHRRIFMNDFEA